MNSNYTLALETDTASIPLDVLVVNKSRYRKGVLEPRRQALESWLASGGPE